MSYGLCVDGKVKVVKVGELGDRTVVMEFDGDTAPIFVNDPNFKNLSSYEQKFMSIETKSVRAAVKEAIAALERW